MITPGSPTGPDSSLQTEEPLAEEATGKSATLGTGTLIAAGCVVVTLLAIVVGIIIVAIIG